MQHRRFLIALANCGLAALVVAGCGGPSKGEYERDMQKIGAAIEDDLGSFRDEQPSEEALADATGTLEEAADDIAKVEAPDDVEQLHAELEEAVRASGDIVGRIAPLMDEATRDPAAMSPGDSAKFEELAEEFGELAADMERITSGFEERGYDIGIEGTSPPE